MENAIRKLNGVKEVSVNFLMQKMTLETEDDVFERVLQESLKIIKKVEPDCRVIL